jgi:uroporphyrinogen-III synthase
MQIAEQEGIAAQVQEALRAIFIGSIGPTTSEALEDYGLQVNFEPTHPKMGVLVNEAAQAIMGNWPRLPNRR